MKRAILIPIVSVLLISGPTFAAIVYSGSQVTLTLQGGMTPPPERAMISIAGSGGDWDDFIINLEYVELIDTMAMGTRLTIGGGMGMGMGRVLVKTYTMPVIVWNLARGDVIGPDSVYAESSLLVEAMAGQTIAGEFGPSGGYIGLVMPGSDFHAWLCLSSMSGFGESNQSVTFKGWAYETEDGKPILAGDTGVIPAPAAVVLGGLGVGFVTWLRRRRKV